MCEYPTFFKKEDRQARKQHNCSECKHTIESKEVYEKIFIVFDRAAQVFKICRICKWVRETLNLEAEDDMYGILWENVRNCGYNIDRNMVSAKLKKDKNYSWLQLEHTFNVEHDTLKQWIADVETMEKERG